MQGLFEDLWSMKWWHVQRRHAAGVTRSWVTLTREGRAAHVRRWCWALIVVLTFSTLFIEGQSQPLAFLSAVTEPHTHHLKKQKQTTSQKEHRQSQSLTTMFDKHQVHIHLSPSQDHQICALFPECWAWGTWESTTRGQCGLNPPSWSSSFFFVCRQKPAQLCTSVKTSQVIA